MMKEFRGWFIWIYSLAPWIVWSGYVLSVFDYDVANTRLINVSTRRYTLQITFIGIAHGEGIVLPSVRWIICASYKRLLASESPGTTPSSGSRGTPVTGYRSNLRSG